MVAFRNKVKSFPIRILKDAECTSGYGGWLSNVTAAINEGNNVGAVTISPLGTIKGKVTLYALVFILTLLFDLTILLT